MLPEAKEKFDAIATTAFYGLFYQTLWKFYLVGVVGSFWQGKEMPSDEGWGEISWNQGHQVVNGFESEGQTG